MAQLSNTDKAALKHVIVGHLADYRQKVEPLDYAEARWLEATEGALVDAPIVRRAAYNVFSELMGRKCDTIRFDIDGNTVGAKKWWGAKDRTIGIAPAAVVFDGKSSLLFDGLTVLAADDNIVLVVKRWGEDYRVYAILTYRDSV